MIKSKNQNITSVTFDTEINPTTEATDEQSTERENKIILVSNESDVAENLKSKRTRSQSVLSLENMKKLNKNKEILKNDVGFTHRSSNTINGDIMIDKHGLKKFLKCVKTNISNPKQQQLKESKSQMLLRNPNQVSHVIDKIKKQKDGNWISKIVLSENAELSNDIKTFKIWVHGEEWKFYLDV